MKRPLPLIGGVGRHRQGRSLQTPAGLGWLNHRNCTQDNVYLRGWDELVHPQASWYIHKRSVKLKSASAGKPPPLTPLPTDRRRAAGLAFPGSPSNRRTLGPRQTSHGEAPSPQGLLTQLPVTPEHHKLEGKTSNRNNKVLNKQKCIWKKQN